MRQEERRARTRAALLKAAATAFASRGYDGASIDAIAASVHLSKGAVYANFPTKRDLYLAVLGGLMDQADLRLDRVVRSMAESRDVLLAARSYFGLGGDTEHASLLAELWRTAAEHPSVRAVLDGYLERRRLALGRAAVDAGHSPGEAVQLAGTIERLIDAEVLYRRLGEGSPVRAIS
jgi:AcrR family transcriptional regulator